MRCVVVGKAEDLVAESSVQEQCKHCGSFGVWTTVLYLETRFPKRPLPRTIFADVPHLVSATWDGSLLLDTGLEAGTSTFCSACSPDLPTPR